MPNQVPAASQAAITRLYITTQTITAIAFCIGEIAEFVDQLLVKGDPERLINTMRGGASVGSCFGKPEFYDSRPYFTALLANYPGFPNDASCLLSDALDRSSTPMILAALAVSRDTCSAQASQRLLQVFSRLTSNQMEKLLLHLWLATSDRELQHLFRK